MNSALRNARLGSGLVLFVFVTTHLLNHALGLISLNAMEGGLKVFAALWRNPIGTLLLYGAIVVHVLATLWRLYTRRTLQMHGWEYAQLVLALAIPVFLVKHVLGTRMVYEVFNVQDNYTYILLVYWKFAPVLGLQQVILLQVAWVHGCIGLHFWLRLNPWYRRARDWLLAAAILVPVLALGGFNQAGNEVLALAKQPGWIERTTASLGLPNQAAANAVERISAWSYVGMALVLALVIAARVIRTVVVRRRKRVRLIYPGSKMVDVTTGQSVLDASRTAGIPHASVCGGRGRCSTCRVRIGVGSAEVPEPSLAEARVLARVGAPPNVRLACQLQPGSGDLEVTPLLPPSATVKEAFGRPAYLQGQEREIAVLFADLRAFTKLSEKKLPFDVVFLLNRYFSAMGQAVVDAGGHLDKFIGDGVMALFGVTSDRDRGCREAISAARAMGENLAELNQSFANDLEEELRIGIGIHAGPAIVGEMGFGDTINLTAVGDTVNTASRLETMTKEFGVQVVVSEAVAQNSELDVSHLEQRQIEIRGREQPLKVVLAQNAAELPATGIRSEREQPKTPSTVEQDQSRSPEAQPVGSSKSPA